MMKVMLILMMKMIDCELMLVRKGHSAAHPPARETFKYSCKCDKEWISKFLKSHEVKCDVNIFINLKLNFFFFFCGCVSLFFIANVLILKWHIIVILKGKENGLKM